jgi:hypothetical protein
MFFPKYEYHMHYVLYPFVTYLLSLRPNITTRTTMFDVHPQISNLIEIRSILSEVKHAKRQLRTPPFIRRSTQNL